MTAAVIGVGQMGQAIAWGMESLGHDLLLVDTNKKSIELCKKTVESPDKHLFKLIGKDPLTYNPKYEYDFLNDSSVVISSLPYHQNLEIASHCIDNNIKYCDLGGKVAVSDTINEYAKNYATAPVVTDLGLAPGWVNIMAEDMYNDHIRENDGTPPKNIEMMVGGLPAAPTNSLKYGCTWSYDGLINEYRDNCVILNDGMRSVEQGMEGLVDVDTDIGKLEAFYTSGGAAHTISIMQKRGVQNCSYKTLRYPGHQNMIKFLIRECDLDDKTLIDIFKKTCPPPHDDVVVIRVQVDDRIQEKVIKSDDKFSAMQQATAFPVAVMSSLVSQEQFSGNVLKYDDIPYDQFNKLVTELLSRNALSL